ncbi:MAG: hypothetical protein GEU28_04820 [Dehalococcoidia bacterium]|nr:hypothetical protein [Dehalococcoidia bacterium]
MAINDPIKAEIRRIVERLSQEDAEDLLDYLNSRADPEELAEEEIAEMKEARGEVARGEVARGEYVTLDELSKRLEH